MFLYNIKAYSISKLFETFLQCIYMHHPTKFLFSNNGRSVLFTCFVSLLQLAENHDEPFFHPKKEKTQHIILCTLFLQVIPIGF